MVRFKGSPPSILLGFVTSNIPNSTITRVIADFKLGAWHQYDPMVELSLDQDRFIGFSPQQIREQLDAEGIRESFVLLDAETTLSRSVWWVGRYLDEEMPSTDADHWRPLCVVNVSSDERILLKARMRTTEAPLFYVNDDIANQSIFDVLDSIYPFDPHGPQEPYSVCDWEHDPPPPPPAYVVATPDEYEISSAAEHTRNFSLNGGAPKEVVRLKEAVARENNLRSEWTFMGMAPGSEEGFPEGSLEFSQPWAIRN